jgi:S1-C subfamily serine protease
MFCPKCGKELPDDSQFCLKCGRALSVVEVPKAVAPKRSGIWLALVLLLVVAGGILAWQFRFRARNVPPPPAVSDAMASAQPQAVPVAAQTAPAPAPQTMSAQEIFQMASGGVTLIQVFDDEGRPRSLGSGFVISPSGTALTNYHVMRGAARATARFSDGTSTEVSGISSYDPVRDVAVIQLASAPSTVLQLGDSDALQVGDGVVAIGSPLGLQNTLSEGIVSGLRDGRIQMSDPISPGSSGGPVFDHRGKVIGISVATVAAGQNLNFAVPIDWAKPYLSSGSVRPLAEVAAENTVIQDALDGSVTIPNGQARTWNIVVNPNIMSNAEIHGEVTSSGGMDGKITLALYLNTQPIYSCRSNSCAIHQNIVTPGTYLLMLDNRVSPIFARTVTGQISLKYVK